MQLTKYEHACFTVEKDDQILVVDPGNFATDFIAPAGVVAIVVTHEHSDHFDPEQITEIIDKNPGTVVIGPEAVTSQIEAFATQTVNAGDKLTVGTFDLEFFGGTHATIHRFIPPVANVGVMINDLLYYPGDSLTLIGRPVDTLALPAGAPWLKIGETMDFLEQISPRFAFPTHDAVLSSEGKKVADNHLSMAARTCGAEYKRLDSPLEI